MPVTLYTKAQVDSKIASPTVFTPTLNIGWENFGSGYQGCRYYKDHQGIVTVSGFVKATGTAWEIFTLPVGFRPSASHVFTAIAADNFASVNVVNTGVFSVAAANFNAAKSWLSFNVQFLATS